MHSQDQVEQQPRNQDSINPEKGPPPPDDSPGEENEIGWDGSDDPANPRNWSTLQKTINTAIFSSITFLSPLASSMFAPGAKDLMNDFHNSSSELASFVVSSYLIGFATGPLVMAPMSELYGRAPIYIIGNVICFAFSIACATAPDIGSFIFFRVVAGIGGSVPLTLGGGSIADLYKREKRGLVMSLFSLGPLLGPVMGPIAGGFLAEAKGWRWVFWLLAILLGVTTAIAVLFLRETYAPVLLQRKTKRLIKETGNTSLRPKYGLQSPKMLFSVAIRRPLIMLILDPIISILSLYLAILFGYTYLLFTTFTSVFGTQYHFSIGIAGLAYIGLGIGCLLGSVSVGLMSDRILIRLTAKHGGAKPEYRLPPMIALGWMVPVGLFWYGWTADKGVHWILPIIGTSFFGLGFFASMMPVQSYLVDGYSQYAASALAANTVLRSVVGAVLPLSGEKLYQSVGIGWGNSLLGFIALAFLPFPWLFYKYGDRIRQWSQREY